MSFNLWEGGDGGGQPLEQTAKVIKAAEADVVGLQETAGHERDGQSPDNARALASMLAWNYFPQADGTGIISRYKFLRPSPKRLGAQIELPSGRRAWVFNVHLMHTPYQPYQLLKIPYGDAPFIETAEEAVREARKIHEPAIKTLLSEVENARGEAAAMFITGDFNEPSSLDWTEAVADGKRCPVVVGWPSSAAILNAGFVDAYRHIRPDPLAAPAYTWTPITSEDDPHDRHDRIDFVYVGGRHGPVRQARIIGEAKPHADAVVAPYPSDHRAFVATVTLE
jgi:exonuclease III